VVRSLGPVFGLIFAVLSISLLALIVLLAMDLRLQAAIPPTFLEEFTDTVNKRRFKEAYELARQDNSFLARVLTTGMSRLQYGIEDAREAAANMADTIRAGKEQFITYLATIGTVGPLLGLVGTVIGMILAFMELGRSGTTPRFDKLAEALSHALVVTLFGIGMAVPAIFCQAFFHTRLVRIAMDTSNLADDLLTQMYHNSKRPPVPTAASAPGSDSRTSAAAIKAEG
jgi:biopolymer transport protein ExbB